MWSVSIASLYHVPGSVNDGHPFHSPPYVSHHKSQYRFQYNDFLKLIFLLGFGYSKALALYTPVGESGALRSGVWFRANNLMIMMTQHNFCLLFD